MKTAMMFQDKEENNEESCEIGNEERCESKEDQAEGSELDSVNKYITPTLISTKLFKEEVYTVCFNDASLTTVLTNFSGSVDQWVTNHQQGHIGFHMRTWIAGNYLEVDLVQICSGQDCILFHTATADKKPLPEKLGSVLKKSLVAASQDYLGEAKKLYRCRGKNGFGCIFERINWLNLRDLSKRIVKDKRVINGDFELLLESIVKTKYNIPNELRGTRWESTLSPKQIFYATYEAYRAYQLGSELLSASGVSN